MAADIDFIARNITRVGQIDLIRDCIDEEVHVGQLRIGDVYRKWAVRSGVNIGVKVFFEGSNLVFEGYLE